MTTNELRAAAERLLNDGMGAIDRPPWVARAVSELAKVWLAEHPADDSERATPEWVVECLGINDSFHFQNEKCYKLYKEGK